MAQECWRKSSCKLDQASNQNGERSRCDEQDGCDVEELAGEGEQVQQEDGADDAAGCYHDGSQHQQDLPQYELYIEI